MQVLKPASPLVLTELLTSLIFQSRHVRCDRGYTFVHFCSGRGEALSTITFNQLEPSLVSGSKIGTATASTCFPSVYAAEPTPATLQSMPS
jgi:hypothetical protein